MRPRADAERINAFLRELGRAARVPTRLYLTGGATAVVEGWRGATVDIHLHLEDVHAMIARALVDPARVRSLFARIEPELYRSRRSTRPHSARASSVSSRSRRVPEGPRYAG